MKLLHISQAPPGKGFKSTIYELGWVPQSVLVCAIDIPERPGVKPMTSTRYLTPNTTN